MVLSHFKPYVLHSQNETSKAVGGAIAAAGLTALAIELSIDEYKTQLAHNAAEFIMSDTFGAEVLRFDLKILELSITDRKDLSGVKLNIFGLRYKNGQKIILLQKCSNGWVSPTGLNVQSIKYYKINVDMWNNMMQKWMDNINESDTDNVVLPTKLPNSEENISFSSLKNITFDDFGNYDFVFMAKRNRVNEPHLIYPLKGTNYYMEKINKDFNLALENGKFSLFFNDYFDLVNIKRKELVEITKFLNQETSF